MTELRASPSAESFKASHAWLYGGVAAAIFVVIAVALAATLHLRHQAEERAALTTQSLARSIEQTLEGMIDAIDVALLAASDEMNRQAAAGKVDAPTVTRLLIRQQERLPRVAYLRATDEHGNVIYGPGVLTPPTNNADRDYFIALRDSPALKLVIVKPIVGRISNRLVWMFARRISKADGSFGGVVFAAIHVDSIGALLAPLHMAPGYSIALRDGDLGVIYRQTDAAVAHIPIGEKQISTPFAAALKINPNEGSYTSGATSIDGVSREHSYRRSAKYGLIVNIALATDVLLAEWRKQVWVIAALALAFVVTSLTFTRLIDRSWRLQEQNIAERKLAAEAHARMERQMQQAQKMQAIGQLTGGIAHDFNNILGAILGFTALFIERFGAQTPAKGLDYLAEVKTAAERAKDLVSSMLAFARGGKGVAEMVAPASLVREVVRMLTATLPSTLQLTPRIIGDIPRIRIDPVELHQIITNLCVNARDALGGQGRIEVCLKYSPRISGRCSASHKDFAGDFVELVVGDDGPGIPAEVLPRIFDPFYTTKDVGKGTGMGLSVVMGIVVKVGGAIVVDSAPGEGSCFRVYLPVAADDRPDLTKAEPAPLQTTKLAAETDGRCIMIVDDEATLGRFLAEVLDSHGRRSWVFSDPREALKAFRDNPQRCSVLLTDQTMPGMTGVALIRALREIRPDLPVILMTGYSDLVDAQSVAALGIRHFFSKPVAIGDLLEALAQIDAPDLGGAG